MGDLCRFLFYNCSDLIEVIQLLHVGLFHFEGFDDMLYYMWILFHDSDYVNKHMR